MKSAIALIGCFLLSSCTPSRLTYVNDVVGYAVTKGEIVKIEDLSSDAQEHLADGIAIRVGGSGCRVTLRFKKPVEVIDLCRGSIIVLGREEDHVLQPYKHVSEQMPGTPEPNELTAPRQANDAKREFSRAQDLLKQNRKPEARKALERAYSLDPENREIAAGLVSLLKQMGLELYSKGDSKGTVECLKEALQIRPDDEEARRFLKRAEAVSQ